MAYILFSLEEQFSSTIYILDVPLGKTEKIL